MKQPFRIDVNDYEVGSLPQEGKVILERVTFSHMRIQ